ncbi:MAG: M20/M25/M40 family metallo-hydrolase [Salinibacterium sp.]|nr:M20/M25/M40 family metallo-hydrolase [Salinibacterium sp.]
MSPKSALTRFQTLLRIPTISYADESLIDWTQFDSFIATIAELYPLVHSRLEREIVAGHTVLFRWPGRGASEPSLLMAHYDVVPATDLGWTHPPFAADVTGTGADEVIWGRGTLDNKGAVTGILEAVERQLATELVPAQDVYLVFTHNEESAGDAAPAVVDLLESRGIRPAFVLDEGGAVVEGVFPAVTAPVAVVGVSEKGQADFRLIVEEQGGHASTPPKVTATVRLAKAIVRINEHPFPARFSVTALDMFRTLGDHASGVIGWAFRNIGLTRFALLPVAARSGNELNAMVRTTQAVTILTAGQAPNALAERAEANINVRIAVGMSMARVLKHLTRSINDEKVRIELVHGTEAPPVSLLSGIGWEVLRATVESTYPGTVVTPYVQNGATDSRHFTRISRGVYRFTPFEVSKDERDALHAKNERLHVATFLRGIEFYAALIAAL